MEGRKKVEIFMGPIACSCAGGPTPERQEKLTRAFLLKRALEKEHADSFEVTVVNLGDEREYEEGITRLKRYIGEAGEGQGEDGIAFSLDNVTPAVSVDGRIISLGDCPSVGDFMECVCD